MAIQTYNEKMGSLKGLLESCKGRIAEVLPKHVTPERMCKTALIAANKTPKLLECDQKSFLQAVMTASELGLDVSGTLGSAYLIPYGKTCQLIVGYRGLIDLARRSGQISTIEAHVVYEQDEFEISFGLSPVLKHKPKLTGERGLVQLVYAVAQMRDGTSQCDVMTMDEVEAIRKRSRSGNNGPWKSDFNEMAKKTVVRRLCKYLPLSPEIERAMALDVENETGQVFDVEGLVEVEPEPSKIESLAEKIAPTQEEIDATAKKRQEVYDDPEWDPNSKV